MPPFRLLGMVAAALIPRFDARAPDGFGLHRGTKPRASGTRMRT